MRCDTLRVKKGGQIRHIFFDPGRDQLIAFMEARDVPGVPAQYDTGINHGLGVPNAFYHFAFEAGSEAGLDEMRNALIARGVEVSDVVDHDEISIRRLGLTGAGTPTPVESAKAK